MVTASWSGKKPNWQWRGSVAQWEQERSDQIRIGEAIFPGFEALNPVRGRIFDTQEDKAARAKWLSDKKKAGKPVVLKKVKKELEFVDASKLGLEDFM